MNATTSAEGQSGAPTGGSPLRSLLIVVATFPLMSAVIATPCYFVGRWGNRHALVNYRAPDDFEAMNVCAIEEATRSSEPSDVVFFGDSTSMQGIEPLLFERLTGLRADNISGSGHIPIVGQLAILRAYLAHHPPPKLLVFSHGVWSFAHPPLEPESSRRFMAEFGNDDPGPRSLREAAKTVRMGVWTMLGVAQGGAEAWRNKPLAGYRSRTRADIEARTRETRGYLSRPGRPGPYYPPESFFWFEPNVAGLEAIIRAASELHIPLYVRFTPAIEEPIAAHYLDPLESWLRQLEAKYPGTRVHWPLVTTLPRIDYCDEDHLNVEGTEVYTTILAHEVPQLLGFPHTP